MCPSSRSLSFKAGPGRELEESPCSPTINLSGFEEGKPEICKNLFGSPLQSRKRQNSKNLHPVVAEVDHDDTSIWTNADARRKLQLAMFLALLAKPCEQHAI